MTTTFAEPGGRSLKKKARTTPSGSLPKLAHELINQLSIISLCRFKISQTFAGDPTRKPTQDFEALENAVQEVTRLVKEITDRLSTPSCSHASLAVAHKAATNPLRIVK